ncbi:MAG: GTP-binding protein, partial [Pseudomonadota bacterium]
VREIEIDRFLTLAGDRLKKTTALVLAVTGNAFKAFPGIGTLTGGVIHAAAYGMIFDSLGRSICASLEERKSLDPVWAADRFEKQLDESVEEKALGYARLALTRWKAENRDD